MILGLNRLYHIISIISYRITSNQVISNHIILHHIISHYIISYDIISYHTISYYIISIISYHIISYHIISYHIISYHIISYHIISYHIISYHIISYHIISYHHRLLIKLYSITNICIALTETLTVFYTFLKTFSESTHSIIRGIRKQDLSQTTVHSLRKSWEKEDVTNDMHFSSTSLKTTLYKLVMEKWKALKDKIIAAYLLRYGV